MRRPDGEGLPDRGERGAHTLRVVDGLVVGIDGDDVFVELGPRMQGVISRRAFQRSIITKIGFLFAKGGLDWIRKHLNPNTHNGAVFLGLNGLVVKSHGGATAAGFAEAIQVAVYMSRNAITRLITDDLENFSSAQTMQEN